MTRELMPRLFEGVSASTLESQYSLIGLQLPTDGCLRQKLDLSPVGWTGCTPDQASPDPGRSPDISFRLAGLPPSRGFSVTTKIVDTMPGNSDRSANDLLDAGDSVTGKDEVIHPQHVPAMYHLSVQGMREEVGVREKARLSVLYAY